MLMRPIFPGWGKSPIQFFPLLVAPSATEAQLTHYTPELDRGNATKGFVQQRFHAQETAHQNSREYETQPDLPPKFQSKKVRNSYFSSYYRVLRNPFLMRTQGKTAHSQNIIWSSSYQYFPVFYFLQSHAGAVLFPQRQPLQKQPAFKFWAVYYGSSHKKSKT